EGLARSGAPPGPPRRRPPPRNAPPNTPADTVWVCSSPGRGFVNRQSPLLGLVSWRGRSAFEGTQRPQVDDGDAAAAGGHEMLVSQRGESACDRFTRGANELADLLL